MKQRAARTLSPWIAGLLALPAVYAGVRSCRARTKPPFELSFWYWHSPFQIAPNEVKGLQDLKVKRLFVRAGTFTSDGTNIVLAIPQTYATKAPFDLHLVFNFDSGVIRHFEHYDLPLITKQIATRVKIQVEAAKSKGERVTGVQFDFDVPTRLLPRYADLVHGIKEQLKSDRLQFSTTALLSWLGTKGIRTLSEQLDFIAPQAYEGVTGKTVDTMRPVSDIQDFRRRIEKADRLACPYFVGIPAYGHAFLFDEKDNLANIYRTLSPVDALRHPSFKLLSAYPSDRLGQPARGNATGEEIMKFKAIRPAPDGRGLGYTLAFTIPSPKLLAGMLQAAKEEQTSDCLGAIIYRYPEPDSVLTLPFETALRTIQDKPTKPDLSVKVESVTDNYDLIEREDHPTDAPRDVFLEIQNTGNAPTFIGPDAIVVDVALDVTGIDEVRLRDMDKAVPGQETKDGTFQETPPKEATAIRLQKGFLAPGQKAYVGPIRLLTSLAKKVDIRWIIRDSDGLTSYQGKAVGLLLESPKK